METLPQMLESAARWYPEVPLLVERDRRATFAQVNADANRLARALREVGVRRGARVPLLLPSRTEFASAYYGVLKADCLVAPLNAMFTSEEVLAMLDYLGADVVVTSADLAGQALAAAAGTGARILLWDAPGVPTPAGVIDLRALAADLDDSDLACTAAPTDIATILHTSGTTGRAKGAAQTHANTVLGARQLITAAGWRFAAEQITCPLPLFNNFGSTVVLNMAVAAAATVHLVERWDTDAVIATFQAGSTRMVGTPTMYIYLLQGHDPARHGDLALEACIVGGQTIPAEARQAFESRFGARLLNLYGATETNAVTLSPLHGPHPDGSVGQPLGQASIRVEDENGDETATGVVGELVLGGDTVCAGYWGDPERTAESFSPHGWRSGDLGYLDGQGYVFVVDRKKDLIITGGANIYPAEIERVLYEHDGVAMAAVIGIPDMVKGEIPKAYVVRAAGSTVTSKELMAILRGRLARYKCPRQLEFVDVLPTSPVGKILKRELRAQVLVPAGAS